MTTDAQIVCPCCERPLDDALPVTALRHVECGPVQSRILDALIRAYPRFVTLPSLVHAAYGDDPNGGPMAADSAIQTHIGKLRYKLPDFGWYIPWSVPPGRGNYGKYRLRSCEELPECSTRLRKGHRESLRKALKLRWP